MLPVVSVFRLLCSEWLVLWMSWCLDMYEEFCILDARLSVVLGCVLIKRTGVKHFENVIKCDSNSEAPQYYPVFHHVPASFTCHDSLYIISLFCRRMMTLKKVTSQSTGGLLPPSISPRWTPQSQRSCSRCPRRAGLWWFLLQCQEIPLRKRQRRSQACGRAASSTPILMFRGSYSLNSFNIYKDFV